MHSPIPHCQVVVSKVELVTFLQDTFIISKLNLSILDSEEQMTYPPTQALIKKARRAGSSQCLLVGHRKSIRLTKCRNVREEQAIPQGGSIGDQNLHQQDDTSIAELIQNGTSCKASYIMRGSFDDCT